MSRRVTRATGAAAIATTLAPNTPFQLEEIRVHLSAAAATVENLTVTVDSGTNAVYDVVLLTQAMNTVADVVYQPTRPLFFEKGDEIDVAYANTNTRTYGLEIIWAPTS